MPKKYKKILITGVAGLVGSHILDSLLKKGDCEVIGIDNFLTGKRENIEHNIKNPRFKFYKADILDFKKLKNLSKGVDIIVHEAAYKKIYETDSSFKLLENNTWGMKNILEIAKLNNAKVVFASTSDVYGNSENLPFKEDNDLQIGPSDIKRWAYSASKIFDEHLCFAYYKDFNVPVVVLRYFGTFGPRASTSWSGGHVPLFIDRIFKKQPILVHGDGKQTRCLSYITDIVDPTVLSIFSQKAIGNIINIGNNEEVSVIDTVHLIHKIMSSKLGKKYPLKIKYVPIKKVFGNYKEIRRRIPNLSKSKKILGYSPKIDFEKGLELYIEWYLKEYA
jgi:UDP-glucose 4-epimerase